MVIRGTTDSKCYWLLPETTLRLRLFENLYSSCQCGVDTANVQLLLWLLLLAFSHKH